MRTVATPVLLLLVVVFSTSCKVQAPQQSVLSADRLPPPVKLAVIDGVVVVTNLYFEYDHPVGLYKYGVSDTTSALADVQKSFATWRVLRQDAQHFLFHGSAPGTFGQWYVLVRAATNNNTIFMCYAETSSSENAERRIEYVDRVMKRYAE